MVYHNLKSKYPQFIYKQYEFLNDISLRNPQHITVEQRYALFDSPTALFLLSRGKSATNSWAPDNVFEEKQNDTADILYFENGCYDIIDVKTRNIDKNAMEPNIISASKLAKACAIMIDNDDFESINIDYIEVDWKENGEKLKAIDAHHANLFKANPHTLYINWAAAMQIQFHVCDLDQTWNGTRKEWAKEYLTVFVASAKSRCDKMYKDYIKPYLKYID